MDENKFYVLVFTCMYSYFQIAPKKRMAIRSIFTVSACDLDGDYFDSDRYQLYFKGDKMMIVG